MPNCKHCGSEKVVKSGFALGKQRHRCKDCGRQFIPGNRKFYSEEQRALVFGRRLKGIKLIEIAAEIGVPAAGNIMQLLRLYPLRHVMAATHNAKKQTELTRIFLPRGRTVITPDTLGLTLPEVEESEDTFAGNALLKARSACALSRIPCFADDSGLCVDALGGAPGIFSARYAGEHGNDGGNIELLLENLRGLPPEKRRARFVCAAVCVYPDGTELIAEESCEGTIALKPRGKGGFGYDPVFLPDGKKGRSMAELEPGEKDWISHRGKALRELAGQMRVRDEEVRLAKKH